MTIDLQNIHKRFGDYVALAGIDLTIEDGEMAALLGPSGSGKTTLLRIIAGLDQPSPGGVIRFDAEDVSRRRAGERRVGFVFQHYALFRHMTVFENIAFGLRVRPRRLRPPEREIRQRVERLLDLVQLEGLAGRFPSQLSGGQRQRVALARALAVEPRVLLLDEPFAALDARVREELRRWLRALHDELHITSVFVTHDQEEALELADRVVVMNRGRIEQVGTPEEVFHQPASEFVMNFLGRVNIFHGRVEADHAVFGGVTMPPPAEPPPSDGQPARLLVRPENLEILTEKPAGPSLPAKVARVQSIGPVVKVELCGPGGERIYGVLSHEAHRRRPLRPHQQVYVRPKDARVFLDGGEGAAYRPAALNGALAGTGE